MQRGNVRRLVQAVYAARAHRRLQVKRRLRLQVDGPFLQRMHRGRWDAHSEAISPGSPGIRNPAKVLIHPLKT